MNKVKVTYCKAFLVACFLFLLSGCNPEEITSLEADNAITDIAVEDIEKESSVLTEDRNAEPFNYTEYGLENIGVDIGMSAEEVIEILGDPLEKRETLHEDLGYPDVELFYDGLTIGFLQPFDIRYYILDSPEISGPRDIKVGDSVDHVLDRFYLDNEEPGSWLNPEPFGWLDITEHCVELYYFAPDEEGLVKCGSYHCDAITGEIISINYYHYIPASCAYSGLIFSIDNNLVTQIEREGTF